MYIKFCRNYEFEETKTKFPDESDESRSLQDFQRRAHLYRGLFVIMSVLSVILLIGVIILCAKLQSQTVCHGENEIPGERVPTPNLCTPRECRQVCLAETSRDLLCSKCDDGWQHFEGSCFYLSTKLHNWSKSREECRKMAGDLVVIGDQRLKEFLVEKGKMAYWIGAIQIKNGETVWVNATVGESYWDQNQIRGNCGYLLGGDSPSQSWHASPCSHETSYICQKNA
ncbi:hypothetical protein SKAU_G00225590 [Synaphobranchus kaupii]|uniref:C-type lectin domain-containing protein n=1 Tax=Synaphobranchus kaupii TaxID=118154 RepID=A0A9Q1IVE6_SYNKA|nr:hypothetical protein SKAU_G00225590 [Synaphobranchus kaupii]